MLWQEKINHILTLDIPEEEITYLEWYAEVFNSFDYIKSTPKELEKEMYEKTIEGMNRFGWSKNFVYQTFFTVGDISPEAFPNTEERIHDDMPKITCTCIYGLGCPGLFNGCDDDFECDITNNNCGLFGSSPCKGYCEDDIFD